MNIAKTHNFHTSARLTLEAQGMWWREPQLSLERGLVSNSTLVALIQYAHAQNSADMVRVWSLSLRQRAAAPPVPTDSNEAAANLITSFNTRAGSWRPP